MVYSMFHVEHQRMNNIKMFHVEHFFKISLTMEEMKKIFLVSTKCIRYIIEDAHREDRINRI